MRRVRPTRAGLARAAALATALLALALALRANAAFSVALGVLALGSLGLPFLEWASPPPRLARALPRALVLVLLAVALVAWLSRSLSLLALPAPILLAVAVPLVLPLAAAFALAPRTFPPGRTLVPAVVFLLGLAGLDPAPRGYGGTALAFLRGADHSGFAEVYLALALAVLGALWTAALLEDGPRWRRRDLLAAGLSIAVALALAAAGVVGLPTLQPRLERAVASAFDQGTTGLSGESALGEFAELAASRRRVLDLRASPPGGGTWRLRSEVFTRFDGRRWSNTGRPASSGPRSAVLRAGPPPDRPVPLLDGIGAWFPVGPGMPPAAGTVALRVDQADVGKWPLLLPRGLGAVTAEAPSLEVDPRGLVRRPGGMPLTLYGALLPRRAPSIDRPLPALEDAEREESLSLPPRVDPRVAELGRRLSLGAKDAGGRLRATVDHLRTGYRYTLAPGRFRPDGDPLAEFLFEKKEAYCEYFASAAVVLLRLQGVPARFVKGLAVGPQNEVGEGLHVVRESDAHAWIEAWLPGGGWVEEDPTPPGALEAARGRPGGLDRLLQRARAGLGSVWNRLYARGPLAFLGWLAGELAASSARAARQPFVWALLVVALLSPRLRRLWRSRRARRKAAAKQGVVVPSELRAQLRAVERRWAARGQPRPASRGLLEHARALATASAEGGGAPVEGAEADVRIVEAYYGARFGASRESNPGPIPRTRVPPLA